MAYNSNKSQSDSKLIIFGIVAFIIVLFCTAAWYHAGPQIVYYTADFFHFMGALWFFSSEQLHNNDFYYQMMLRYPTVVTVSQWYQYIDFASKPIGYLLGGACALIAFKSIFKTNSLKPIHPKDLMLTLGEKFPEILPVAEIQQDIVDGKAKGWSKQKTNEQILKKARYQGKPVLVVDPESVEQKIIVDKDRLTGYLEQTRKIKINGEKCTDSPFLGRLLFDITKDRNKKINPLDRLSTQGRALFAVFAPWAFGNKAESGKVADAINRSAYGSKTGMPNLSISIIDEVFEKYKTNDMALRIAKVHHWEATYLVSLLEMAKQKGKIGHWKVLWAKPACRHLFYALNSLGRKGTPHPEAALAYSQLSFERACLKSGVLPINPSTGQHTIFSKHVVEDMARQWIKFRDSEEDQDSIFDMRAADQIEDHLDLLGDLDIAFQDVASQLPPPPDDDAKNEN